MADPIGHQVKAILFDLDGTLVETDNRWAQIMGEKLAPLQRVFPRLNTGTLGRRVVMAIETPSNYIISLIEHLGLGNSIMGIADRVRRSKGLATRGASEAVEDTVEMLSALSGHYQLAIVTTRARPEAMAFLKHLAIDAFFPVVVTRQDVLRMKPHPEPVQKAARALGVDPRQCIMVGDTVMDIKSAKRAGAVAVGVLSGFGERQELTRAGADLILDRASQLLPYLDPNTRS